MGRHTGLLSHCTLLFQVGDKVEAGDRLTWSKAQFCSLFGPACSPDVIRLNIETAFPIEALVNYFKAFRLLKWT